MFPPPRYGVCMWCTLIELADGPARTIVFGSAEVPPSRRTFVQGVLVRESPFGAELEDAPFVLEVCGLHYGLLGEVCNDSGGGPHG